MFSENLKMIRKNKGISQEQLALKLHVVRQTISKWEKGLSVPDAQLLIELADVLEVSVSDLLGEKVEEKEHINEVAIQLERLNELMAIRIQKREENIKKICDVILIIIFLLFLAAIYPSWNDMWYEFGKNLYNWFN